MVQTGVCADVVQSCQLAEPALLSMGGDEDSRPKFKTSSPVEYVSMGV